MEALLENYLRFIDAEADNDESFDPDCKIKDQFGKIIDELDFRLATIKFEMDSLIDIPNFQQNYAKTLRELVTLAEENGKVRKSDAPAFLKKKKAEMVRVAKQMALELQKMFI